MNNRLATVLLLFLIAFSCISALRANPPKKAHAVADQSEEFLKGRADANADVKAGHLRLKEFPLPYPPHFPRYIDLLKQRCGVEWVTVKVPEKKKHPRDEIDGYNSVMRREIARRFGDDIFQKLSKESQQ